MTCKQQIFEIVKQIPTKKVASFGQIGDRVGVRGQVVGWILSGMKQEEWELIPWYRVVAKNGHIASMKLGFKGQLQKEILLQEGYELDQDTVNIEKHRWEMN